MNIKKSRMVIYVEFHRPQKPEYVETKIRELVKRKQLPSIRNIMIGIDHKNLRTITPMSVLINEKNKP